MSTEQNLETPEQFGKDSRGIAERWRTELQLAKKEFEPWDRRVNEIMREYRDESQSGYQRAQKKFNLYWSNIQTLQPALYSQTPIPAVERRFKDSDPVGRMASTVLERTLSYFTQPEVFDSPMKQARDDYLLGGRGVVWVRYCPQYQYSPKRLTEDELDLLGTSDWPYEGVGKSDIQKDAEGSYFTQKELVFEKVVVDEVYFQDFLMSPARYWREVRWVAKRVLMRKDQLEKFFGKQVAEQIPCNYSTQSQKRETDSFSATSKEAFMRAQIWEIWSKEDRKVYWICEDCDYVLKSYDDPLQLKEFFPCPKPLFGTMTPGTIIPVPDYCLWQDQITEIHELTTRINLLSKAIRVTGVYDSSNDGVHRILSEGAENKLYPIESWARFAEKGGLESAVDFLPIQPIAEVMNILHQVRDASKQEGYEVTGISDVVRGSTHPRESAAAQKIKSEYTSMRLSERQREVQRFARDTIAIMAEIISEHFEPETLWMISGASLLPEAEPQQMMPGAPPTPPPVVVVRQQFDQAVELLRVDALRNFRIDIETESTLAIYKEKDKEERLNFIKAAAMFLRQAAQLSQIDDSLSDFLGHLLMFGLRDFRAGRNLEGVLEKAIKDAKQKRLQQQMQPPKPTPEEIKANAEAQKAQAEVESKQGELEIKKQEIQSEHQLHQEEMLVKNRELDIKEKELLLKEKELELKAQELGAKIEGEKASQGAERIKLQTEREKNGLMALNEQGNPVKTRKVIRLMDDPMNPGQRMGVAEDIPEEQLPQ